MDLFAHLKTFTLVAAHGGFTDAARQLGVVPSVVAKRIGQLEESLGSRLFERTTRSVRLTEAGEQLQARAAALVASFDELMRGVKRDEAALAGHIRVMAPTTLTMTYLGDLFCEFLKEHEQITMEVALVDHSANPAEQDFDLAISGRSASYEGVIDVPLSPVNSVVCASPSYLARRAEPAHPRELADHDCLVFRPSGANWQFQSARGAINIDVKPRLLADDNNTLMRAAVAGLGIASLPQYVVGRPIQAGQLVKVLAKFPPQETWFKAYVPKRKQYVVRIVTLIDWLSCRFASSDWQLEPTPPR